MVVKRIRFRGLKIILIILISIVTLSLIIGGINAYCYYNLMKYARSFDKVEYENQLTPVKQEGYYTFVTNEEFKVLQITDVHLGSGFLSLSSDKKTLNCISAMISYEKPDLVIFTGDIAFPVPYVSGTFNDKTQPNILMELMDTLGVYYTVALGNHDSEIYSYYDREHVNEFYLNGGKYSLYTDDYQLTGCGNQIINVKNSDGFILKSLFVIDSNSYLPSDPLGIKWEYDNVGEDVILWMEQKMDEFDNYNSNLVSSLDSSYDKYRKAENFVFLHIPVGEYKVAYDEYRNNGFKDTTNVKYIAGEVGEEDPYSYGPLNEDFLFEKLLDHASTKAIFCGHDHLNNITLNYKGIDLVYGMSIDYLAYSKIDKYGKQRGCTVITLNDLEYSISKENYYQDKYVSKYEKEAVTFEDYYD